MKKKAIENKKQEQETKSFMNVQRFLISLIVSLIVIISLIINKIQIKALQFLKIRNKISKITDAIFSPIRMAKISVAKEMGIRHF